jgi:hypothetical protein
MTPEERQLLSGLFDRIQGSANQPRDRDAETFISEAVRTQPYAPYLLAQTVIVQEHALRAASERLQQLEAQVQQAAANPPPQQDTSFLGNIGRSLFGAAPQAAPTQPRQPTPGYGAPQDPDPYAQQRQGAPQAGPWGQQAPQQQGGWGQQPPQQGGWGQQPPQQGGFGGGGGSFLKGALGAAAGVAGGVMLADSIKGLFGGNNNPFGIASGTAGEAGRPGGETVVNNYYGDSDAASANATPADDARQDALQDDDERQDFLQDASDDFDDGSYDDNSDNI